VEGRAPRSERVFSVRPGFSLAQLRDHPRAHARARTSARDHWGAAESRACSAISVSVCERVGDDAETGLRYFEAYGLIKPYKHAFHPKTQDVHPLKRKHCFGDLRSSGSTPKSTQSGPGRPLGASRACPRTGTQRNPVQPSTTQPCHGSA